MKKIALLAGVALLSACGAKKDYAEPDAAATEAAPADTAAMTTANGTAPGSYDVTLPDGSKRVSTLMADGTYVDRDEADKVVEKGTWSTKDGKTCFDAEGEMAEQCYTEGARAADGSFEAIGPDGTKAKVSPHAS